MQLSDGSAENGGAVEAAARAVQASLRLQSDTLVGVPGRCAQGCGPGTEPCGSQAVQRPRLGGSKQQHSVFSEG